MDKVFKENPELKSVFKTADGKFFFTEDTAKMHAKSLDEKRVEKLERPLQVVKVEESSSDVNLSKLKRAELVEYATKECGLEIGDETKAEIIALIEQSEKQEEGAEGQEA